jgi:exodeoxyribonuclease-1
LGINKDEMERRARLISETDDFQTCVGDAISNRYPPEEPSAFVEERIYDGFPSRADELLMQRFHQVHWEQRAEILGQINDLRIRELGYRLVHTERPNVLPAEKRAELDAWCGQRLRPNIEVPWLTIAAALDEAEKLLAEKSGDKDLVVEVRAWLQTIRPAQA